MLSLASILAGCNASTRSADDVREVVKIDARLPDVKPPPDLLRACARPVRLMNRPGKARDRNLSAGETERLWRTDRMALVDCADRKAAVQDFYADRDGAIARGAGH